MDSQPINILLKKIKEKEQRDIVNTKRIKECEATIKKEEEKIKHYQVSKNKMKDDISRKMLENSKLEITHKSLEIQKSVWHSMMEQTFTELKEEETKLDILQQSVCQDRINFCDKARELLEKHKSVEMYCGVFKERSSILKSKIVQTDNSFEEYNLLSETVLDLEKQLEKLNIEIAQIEQAKQFKVQLNSEPSCGNNFLWLQNSIKEKKDELAKIEHQINNTKSEIAKKDLLILTTKKNYPDLTFKKSVINPPSTNVHAEESEHSDTQNISERIIGAVESGDPNTSESSKIGITNKVVTFKNTTESRQYSISPQLRSILKSSTFKSKSPSVSLKKKLAKNLNTKLEQEIKDIIFKK